MVVKHSWIVGLCLGMAACGGGEKKVAEPEPEATEELVEEEPEEVQIPAERFDEIRHTLERKSSVVARCFPPAVEAGELPQAAQVRLTLGMVIKTDGSLGNLKIISISSSAPSLEACVIKSASRWNLGELPRDLEYSHSYSLQQL